jgi:hypothetical protein
MGVIGLSSYLQKNYPTAAQSIDLTGRASSNQTKLSLYFDGNGLYHYFYNHQYNNVCGGDYKLFRTAIIDFFGHFLSSNVRCVVVMDGVKLANKNLTRYHRANNRIMKLAKFSTQINRVLSNRVKLSELNSSVDNSLLPLPELCLISFLQTLQTAEELRDIELLNSTGENDGYLAALCRSERGFAVVGLDSDFFIYDLRYKQPEDDSHFTCAYYIPLDSIIVQDNNHIHCRAYSVVQLSECLELPICYLPTFACLVSNDSNLRLNYAQSALINYFHKKTKNKHIKHKHFNSHDWIECVHFYLSDKVKQFTSTSDASKQLAAIVSDLFNINQQMSGQQGAVLSSQSNQRVELLFHFLAAQQHYNVVQLNAAAVEESDAAVSVELNNSEAVSLSKKLWLAYSQCKVSPILFSAVFNNFYQQRTAFVQYSLLTNEEIDLQHTLRPARVALIQLANIAFNPHHINYHFKELCLCNAASAGVVKVEWSSAGEQWLKGFSHCHDPYLLIFAVLNAQDFQHLDSSAYSPLLQLAEEERLVALIIHATLISLSKLSSKSKLRFSNNYQYVSVISLLLLLHPARYSMPPFIKFEPVYQHEAAIALYIFSEIYEYSYLLLQIIHCTQNHTKLSLTPLANFFNGQLFHFLYSSLQCHSQPDGTIDFESLSSALFGVINRSTEAFLQGIIALQSVLFKCKYFAQNSEPFYEVKSAELDIGQVRHHRIDEKVQISLCVYRACSAESKSLDKCLYCDCRSNAASSSLMDILSSSPPPIATTDRRSNELIKHKKRKKKKKKK